MAAKKKNSKTVAQVEASPIAAGPSAGMLALLAPMDTSKLVLKRRNMPRMVLPKTVPIGSAISGEIMAILDSPTSAIKGKLLHLKHESGAEFCFPATGVIRQALAPGATEKDLVATLEKNVGKLLVVKRLEDGTTTKYCAPGEAAKKMFVFDVFTS